MLGWLHSVARSHVDVALKHPIKLIANALGSPPKDVIEQAHAAGVPVAALAGSAKHALRHVENGVDIVVAQGHEAGGHTGEIGSMVLWPEIVDALDGKAPVLGGRRHRHRPSGRGRAGARCAGRVDGLGVPDRGRIRPGPPAARRPVDHPGRAAACDVRGHRAPASIYTGKPARLLKSQVDRRLGRPRRAGAVADAAAEHPGQRGAPADERVGRSDTVSMPVGQIVGRMNEIRPVADIIAELVRGFEDATKRLDEIREG